MNQITQLRAEIADMMEKVRILEAEKVESSQEIHKLKEAIALKKAEADKEMRQRDRLERELKDARLLIDQKNTEIRGKQEAINRSKDDLVKLEALIKDQKITIEKTTKEFEHLQLKMSKLQQDYEDQVLTTNQLLSENQEKNSEIKVRDNELSKIKDELRSISRLKDTLQRKIKILEEERQKAENDRSQLKVSQHYAS
jgi:chromosome segregation ATPase